ncbi:MAG: hypothetical protein HN368_10555 [Spirochaetales bacterium]|nr:hypothetical protein [Spirochaetales bacterium]
MSEYLVLLLLVILIGIFSFILFQTRKAAVGPKRRTKKEIAAEKNERTRPCPLCGSPLRKGETVKTVVYPGKSDTIAEVFGCRYCFGDAAIAVRKCPVCKDTVPEDGYVVGRMFREGKHLHVVGCTRCRKHA